MNIFGWTITKTDRSEAQRARDARNAAAMTSSVGIRALPGEATAARIHRDEVEVAKRILRRVMDRQFMFEESQRRDYRPDVFAATMHKQFGAAAAVEVDPQFAPIVVEQIELLERAVADLAALAAMGLHSETPLSYEGRGLLEDLYARLGHAEAIEHLGTVAVFAQHTHAITGTASAPALESGQ